MLPEARAVSSDVAIAAINAREIHTSDVAAQALARKCSAKEALDDLIDAEVLVQEAVRRGLDRDDTVWQRAKDEMVLRLLRSEFEKSVTPSAIPADEVSGNLNQRRIQFDHPDLVQVLHILTAVKSNASAEERALDLELATEIAKQASTLHDAAKFRELPDMIRATAIYRQVKQQHPLSEEIVAMQYVTPREGPGAAEGPFAEAAFALRNPGDTTPPVETRFGYHVICLVARVEAQHVSATEAEARVRADLFPAFREREFGRTIDEAMTHHHIELYPERLK